MNSSYRKNTNICFLVIYIFILPFLFSSCARIFNRNQQDITVYTTEPSRIVFNRDTLHSTENSVHLIVTRQKEPFYISVLTNKINKKIEINSHKSFMYWSNLAFFYGIGMLIDRKSPKKYAFPNRIYLNSGDTLRKYFKHDQADKKGTFDIHVSLPHINSFRLTPENEITKDNTGFWGLLLGIDYYHKKNQFANFSISGVSDFFVPVPAAITLTGEYESMSSAYMSISNNHKFGRFSSGYGLSCARNTWNFRIIDKDNHTTPTREPIKRSHTAFGMVFSTYFQLGHQFYIGAIYRPTFFRPWIANKFVYEHLFSVDFAWKIRLPK